MEKLKKGILIVIEGAEGVGKTTIAKKLVSELNDIGYESIYFREPGGNDMCEKIRNLALYNEIDAVTETLLMCAARSINVEKNILPSIDAGKIVVLDRFTLSTLVYQGILGGVNIKFINEINKLICKKLDSSIYQFILECDPYTCIKRIESDHHEKNKNDIQDVNFHIKLYNAYHNIVQSEQRHVFTEAIDTANLSEDDTLLIIKKHIQKIINSYKNSEMM